jgi:hypothetical protein
MKFSGSDALVSGAVLAGVCGLLWLFALDMNAASSRAGQKPLGTVIFKKLSATRRPSDGLGWERMRNNGPVYGADTLRTADASEATIYFDDGTSLDINENSMLRLDFGRSIRNLEFIEGEISVRGSKERSSYTISSAAGMVTVGVDSSATFSRNGEKVNVEVSEGDAVLVRADGTTQSIAQDQELEIDLKNGAAAFVSRPIVPTSPAINARILSYASRAGRINVGFAWKLAKKNEAGSTPEKYTIEVSDAKDFSSIVERHQTDGLSARLDVRPGTWYWRVRNSAGTESPVRKFSLVSAQTIRPTFPEDGAEFRYRAVKPEVRFAWTDMDEATAYLFELSSDASFSRPVIRSRVETSSLSVRDIGDGAWFWRVKPVHGFTETGTVPASETRTVNITRTGVMETPVVSTPFEGMLFPIQGLEGKGLSFAWVPQDEAVSYELSISASSALDSPVITVPVTSSYTRIAGKQAMAISRPGVWYWGVRALDQEGNRSPVSRPRKIQGVDSSIMIRQTFPPDGYRIADSLASNTRFSWKSNVAARTVFVVSQNADFSNPIFTENVSTETILGKAWPVGSYYWKLRAVNMDGSTLSETPPRSFTIVGPLPGAALTSPASGAPFYLHEHDKATVKWDAVPECDYYTVGIYSPDDDYLKPVFEQAHVEKNEITCPLGDLPGGVYIVRIQGFAMETENSTRIIGFIGSGNVNYRRISYIDLIGPVNGSSIPGIVAWRNGISMQYKADTVPDTQEFLLYRDGEKDKVFARGSGNGNAFLRKKLAPGRYSWTVKGTVSGFDISAQGKYSFEVLPIPPLPKPALIGPPSKTVLDADRLRADRTIVFKWQPVAGATHYNLTISREGTGMPVLFEDKTNIPEFTMKDLSKLAKGSFVWRIEARSYDSEGEIEQPGIPAESSFLIDLPAVKPATSKYGDTLYGQ